jgi:hypothetical protein
MKSRKTIINYWYLFNNLILYHDNYYHICHLQPKQILYLVKDLLSKVKVFVIVWHIIYNYYFGLPLSSKFIKAF